MDAFQKYLEDYFSRDASPSQSVVANRAGVNRISLNRIIKGRSKPSLETAQRIAEATGTTLSRILRKSKKYRPMN